MEIRNPAKIPTDLNSAEEKFVRCLAEGQPCIIGDGELPTKGIESGEGANVVRSEVIRFFAFGGDVNHPVRGAHIFLQGAWIPSQAPLNLMHARIPYFLGMLNCHLGSDILMNGIQCVGLSLVGSRLRGNLNGEGAKINGSVFFRGGFVAKGEIRLIGAHIVGHLDCENGQFLNPKNVAIVADGIRVDGDVQLRSGFFAEGGVRFPIARIGGALDCSQGTFNNSNQCAIVADGVYVRSHILMKGASITGGMQLSGGHIGGRLDCEGGCFYAKNGVALHADGLTATKGISLRGKFVAKGQVRLLHARTDGNLDCSSGTFHSNPGQYALSADLAYVGGTVSLSDKFSAIGEVRFPSARIGALECDGKFENRENFALCASEMEVRGGVALRAQFQGEVMLIGTHIGKSLSVTGTLNNPKRIALNAERVEAKEGILWIPNGGEGEVHFGFAKIGILVDRENSWESFDRVALNGFTYNQFADPADAQFRINWLSKRPDGIPFFPQPYEQAAKVLFGMGHVGDAREILLEKERLQTADGKMSRMQRVGRRLWDVFAGYGYRLSYTAAWILGVVAIGAVIFDAADARRRIVPTQVIVQADPDYGHAVKSLGVRPTDVVPEIFPGYAEFTPFAYSLDVFIPFFILQQESAWLPDSGDSDNVWKPSIMLMLAILALAIFAFSAEWIERRCEGPRGRACAYAGMLGVLFAICCYFSNWLFCDWWWLTVWYWLEIIAGWILTSLFLLSVTGLLRPRQSSGEKN